jgi:hypothetical protein
MKALSFFACIAAISLGISAPAVCQSDNSSAQLSQPDQATSKRNVRFTSLGFPVSDIYYEIGSQKVSVYASSGSLGPPYPMPKGKTLRLFHDIAPPPNAPAGTKPRKQEVGVIELPEGSRLIVVMAAPEDLTKAKLQGKAYKDSYQTHPSGVARVFNVSPKEINFRCGQKSVQLPLGGSDFLPFQAIAYGSTAYQIATRAKSTDPWKLAAGGEAAVAANCRFFVFVAEIIDTDGTKIFTVNVVSDPIPEKAED